MGTKYGPLHYAFDWRKEDKGRYIKQWDGLDSTGSFNLLDNSRCIIALNYFTEDTLDDVWDETQTLHYDDRAFIGRMPKSLVLARLYRAHHIEFPYEPKAELVFPETITRTQEGLPIITNSTPIVIQLNDADAKFMRRERFAVQIFIDDIFISGEPEGYSPYTFEFNPQGLNEGKHQVIVNLRGLYDHIGIGEAVVYVKH